MNAVVNKPTLTFFMTLGDDDLSTMLPVLKPFPSGRDKSTLASLLFSPTNGGYECYTQNNNPLETWPTI